MAFLLVHFVLLFVRYWPVGRFCPNVYIKEIVFGRSFSIGLVTACDDVGTVECVFTHDNRKRNFPMHNINSFASVSVLQLSKKCFVSFFYAIVRDRRIKYPKNI